MKTGGLTIFALAMAMLCAISGAAQAVDVYNNGFEDDLVGPGMPANLYNFSGSGGGTLNFAPEVTATGGAGGTQGFTVNTDASLATGFWFGGVGQFAVFADDSQRLAGGVAGTELASRWQMSMDIKVSGNNGGAGNMPVYFRLSAIDNDYDATYGIDGNNNAQVDGAAVWVAVVNPVLVDGAGYTNFKFTLDQGNPTGNTDTGVLPAHRVFNNNLSLLWQLNWGGAEFALDAGNVVSIDNVRITFLEAVAGDYNSNGTVDSADYIVWRDTQNMSGFGLAADGTGPGLDGVPDGVVDINDYNFWKANFGKPGAGAGAVVAAAAPEPGTAILLVMALAGVMRITDRRRGCVSARNG